MSDSKVAVCAIAKNEDDYIEEWCDYYLKSGVDDIYVYQNDWRCSRKLDDSVRLLECDGSCRQFFAYNDFVSKHHGEYDFCMFIDIDEFLTIKNGLTLWKFLEMHSESPSIAVNWRLFGDNGRKSVENGDYSLLKRFTRCESKLNHHVKQIVNMRMLGNSFGFFNPHFIATREGWVVSKGADGSDVVGFFNEDLDVCNHEAYFNHYFTKTLEEWVENKQRKGRCDFPYGDPHQTENNNMEMFAERNKNEVEDTTARDFMYGK